eukprot:TRINITY_DN6251_c0_g2_i2.p1 TRINITY_DN6251_c0_g2~~TRINITY_DN6251_c0_g2_i2.p1  ORF type:complete len:477 (-),score=74.07 TRINITY_DN6251_c0_g2_i2:45-1475(-)
MQAALSGHRSPELAFQRPPGSIIGSRPGTPLRYNGTRTVIAPPIDSSLPIGNHHGHGGCTTPRGALSPRPQQTDTGLRPRTPPPVVAEQLQASALTIPHVVAGGGFAGSNHHTHAWDSPAFAMAARSGAPSFSLHSEGASLEKFAAASASDPTKQHAISPREAASSAPSFSTSRAFAAATVAAAAAQGGAQSLPAGPISTAPSFPEPAAKVVRAREHCVTSSGASAGAPSLRATLEARRGFGAASASAPLGASAGSPALPSSEEAWRSYGAASASAPSGPRDNLKEAWRSYGAASASAPSGPRDNLKERWRNCGAASASAPLSSPGDYSPWPTQASPAVSVRSTRVSAGGARAGDFDRVTAGQAAPGGACGEAGGGTPTEATTAFLGADVSNRPAEPADRAPQEAMRRPMRTKLAQLQEQKDAAAAQGVAPVGGDAGPCAAGHGVAVATHAIAGREKLAPQAFHPPQSVPQSLRLR